MLTSMPINAGGWLTRRKKVPTRNTPRIGPLISDAIESAMLVVRGGAGGGRVAGAQPTITTENSATTHFIASVEYRRSSTNAPPNVRNNSLRITAHLQACAASAVFASATQPRRSTVHGVCSHERMLMR